MNYSTSEQYEGYWTDPNAPPVALDGHHAMPDSRVPELCYPYTSAELTSAGSTAFQGTRYTLVDSMYYREEHDYQQDKHLSDHHYQVNVADIGSIAVASSLPLHAPIPLPGQSALLSCSDLDAPGYSTLYYPTLASYHDPRHIDYCADTYSQALCDPQNIPLNYQYASLSEPLQGTFPTPSELLVELAGAQDSVSNADSLIFDNGPETARKARRRATALSVGFIPTDPDSITSHEKKRHYLECLEQYVTYLHQQLNIIGTQPVGLERVSSDYRGLTSRSIRTMLVHMENTTRKLNLRTLSEEQKFLELREVVHGLEDATQGSAS